MSDEQRINFPKPDLRGIDGATHSEWRFLRVPANEMLIMEKDLHEIIKRACLAYAAQQVREPMSDEQIEALRQQDDCGEDVPEFARIVRIAERACADRWGVKLAGIVSKEQP